MLSNDNHNSSCNFAEQMVSFIYGEITDGEKANFEAHLRTCPTCAEETAEFGFVRSSLRQWRARDFENLSTPAFEVSAPKARAAGSVSWIDSIRRLFSPASLGASAAFAALLLCVAFFWFFTPTGEQSRQIAGNRSDAVNEAVIAPQPEKTPDETAATRSDSRQEEIVSLPKPKTQARAVQTEETTTAVKPARAAAKNPAPVKLKNSVASTDKNNKTAPKTPRKNNIPTLSYDEYEDDSLRLSDILKEVSMR